MPSAVVCDDDPMSRRVLSGLLEAQGYEIAGEAGLALEALELVSESHPDVLVLDVYLPGISGNEIVADVRDCSPHTVVVMVSAYPTDSLPLVNAEKLADAVLTKTELVHFNEVFESVMAARRSA
jgi:CheY-like chemotaxis protein